MFNLKRNFKDKSKKEFAEGNRYEKFFRKNPKIGGLEEFKVATLSAWPLGEDATQRPTWPGPSYVRTPRNTAAASASLRSKWMRVLGGPVGGYKDSA